MFIRSHVPVNKVILSPSPAHKSVTLGEPELKRLGLEAQPAIYPAGFGLSNRQHKLFPIRPTDATWHFNPTKNDGSGAFRLVLNLNSATSARQTTATATSSGCVMPASSMRL